MFETHDGLSGQYEVSCTELDFLVEEARKFDFVLGARMMGGGFGGCTINIVKESKADHFVGTHGHLV
jgi:galactokinase